jgi:CBS domain containing-hemolysin-like protein
MLFSLLFCAFFSGVEVAFSSADKLYFEVKNKKDRWADKLLAPFFKNPNRFLIVMALGHTLSFVIFAIYSTQHFLPYWLKIFTTPLWGEGIALLCQILVIGMLSIWVSEILPKPFFLMNPDKILETLALPISISYFILYYTLGYPTLWAYKKSLEFFKLPYEEQKPVYRISDLRRYFKRDETLPTSKDQEATEENREIPLANELLGNAIDFKEVLVKDCMIPKEEVVMIDINASVENVYNKTLETGHSRILVYESSPNNIIGYTHPVSLLRAHKAWTSNLVTIVKTLPTEKANDLLVKLNQHKKTLALVMSDTQEVLGLVSVEDLMEKIFGEIEDEYDLRVEG